MDGNARVLSTQGFSGQWVRTVPALAGIIAPILFWVVLITAGLIRPGYNPIRQFGSELGVGPNAWLMNGTFILWGLLQLPFAWGLNRSIERKPSAVIAALGPALIAVAGIAMVLVGLFPMSLAGTPTFAETMHARAAKVLFGSMPLAFFALAPRFRADPRWQAYAAYSIVAGGLGEILFVIYYWSHGLLDLSHWIGLEQRMLLAVTLGWLGILALRLYRLEMSTQPAEHRRLTTPEHREGA